MARLQEWAAAAEVDFYTARLSTEDHEKIGYYVARSFSPQLHPMHLFEAAPYVTSKRLHSVPQTLGLETATTLNSEPHPYP